MVSVRKLFLFVLFGVVLFNFQMTVTSPLPNWGYPTASKSQGNPFVIPSASRSGFSTTSHVVTPNTPSIKESSSNRRAHMSPSEPRIIDRGLTWNKYTNNTHTWYQCFSKPVNVVNRSSAAPYYYERIRPSGFNVTTPVGQFLFYPNYEVVYDQRGIPVCYNQTYHVDRLEFTSTGDSYWQELPAAHSKVTALHDSPLRITRLTRLRNWGWLNVTWIFQEQELPKNDIVFTPSSEGTYRIRWELQGLPTTDLTLDFYDGTSVHHAIHQLDNVYYSTPAQLVCGVTLHRLEGRISFNWKDVSKHIFGSFNCTQHAESLDIRIIFGSFSVKRDEPVVIDPKWLIGRAWGSLVQVSDAPVNSEDPDGHYGQYTFLPSGAGWSFWIKFSLPPIPKNKITSATLAFYGSFAYPTGVHYLYKSSTDNWSEDEITYNYAQAYLTHSPTPTASIEDPDSPMYRFKYAVTEDVKEEVDIDRVITWTVEPASGNTLVLLFAADEMGGNGPYLMIYCDDFGLPSSETTPSWHIYGNTYPYNLAIYKPVPTDDLLPSPDLEHWICDFGDDGGDDLDFWYPQWNIENNAYKWSVPGWFESYQYRKSHTIHGSSTHSLDGYPMRIVVDFDDGIEQDFGDTIFVDGKCQPDFDDIRFTSADKLTTLPHWRESYTSGDQAVFWIKTPNIPHGTYTTIYVYYGCSGAVSGSDINTTFDAACDHEEGDFSDWTNSWGSAYQYISTSYPHTGNKCLRMIPRYGFPSSSGQTLDISTYNDNHAYGVWIYDPGYTRSGWVTNCFISDDSDSVYLGCEGESGFYQYWDGSGWQDTDKDRTTGFHYFEFRCSDTTTSLYVDGSWVHDSNRLVGGSLTDFKVYCYRGWPYSSYFDDAIVRQWVEDEPEHTSWGTEEERATDDSNSLFQEAVYLDKSSVTDELFFAKARILNPTDGGTSSLVFSFQTTNQYLHLDLQYTENLVKLDGPGCTISGTFQTTKTLQAGVWYDVRILARETSGGTALHVRCWVDADLLINADINGWASYQGQAGLRSVDAASSFDDVEFASDCRQLDLDLSVRQESTYSGPSGVNNWRIWVFDEKSSDPTELLVDVHGKDEEGLWHDTWYTAVYSLAPFVPNSDGDFYLLLGFKDAWAAEWCQRLRFNLNGLVETITGYVEDLEPTPSVYHCEGSDYANDFWVDGDGGKVYWASSTYNWDSGPIGEDAYFRAEYIDNDISVLALYDVWYYLIAWSSHVTAEYEIEQCVNLMESELQTEVDANFDLNVEIVYMDDDMGNTAADIEYYAKHTVDNSYDFGGADTSVTYRRYKYDVVAIFSGVDDPVAGGRSLFRSEWTGAFVCYQNLLVVYPFVFCHEFSHVLGGCYDEYPGVLAGCRIEYQWCYMSYHLLWARYTWCDWCVDHIGHNINNYRCYPV